MKLEHFEKFYGLGKDKDLVRSVFPPLFEQHFQNLVVLEEFRNQALQCEYDPLPTCHRTVAEASQARILVLAR